MMKDCIDEENLDYEYGKKDPDTKKPDDFSYRKWVAWEEMVYYYFIATKKSWGLPFRYFIHKILPPSGIVIDREQDIIQNAPLQGNIFYRDTKKILGILKDITVDNDDET